MWNVFSTKVLRWLRSCGLPASLCLTHPARPAGGTWPCNHPASPAAALSLPPPRGCREGLALLWAEQRPPTPALSHGPCTLANRTTATPLEISYVLLTKQWVSLWRLHPHISAHSCCLLLFVPLPPFLLLCLLSNSPPPVFMPSSYEPKYIYLKSIFWLMMKNRILRFLIWLI